MTRNPILATRRGFDAGTGPAERGQGAAGGTSVNVAFPAGTGDAAWLRAFHAVVPG